MYEDGREYDASGPGIGGSYGDSKITINGGIVTAQGGDYAAGIGGGAHGWGGDILITGGIVTAISKTYTQAIGCGPYALEEEGELRLPGMRVTEPAEHSPISA